MIVSAWICLCFPITLHLCLANQFNALRKSASFVDKSELLAVFFNSSVNPYNLITCPFKFGKTTNVDMIALFCDLEVDKKTRKPRPQNNTYAYGIFESMKIARHRRVMQDHLGRHPVLRLSFPENLEVSPKTALGAELKKSIHKYRWLTNLTPKQLGSVDPEDIEYLKKLQSDDPTKLRITEAVLRICRVLYQYFDQSGVILLVDNYDNTSCRSFVNEADPKYTLEYYKYLNKMISRAVLNGTEYISRAMLVGLTSLPFSLAYCDLSVIRQRPFLENHPFSGHFGYLEYEADRLLTNFSLTNEMKSYVLGFYRGYRIETTNSYLFNPHTINQFQQRRQKIRAEQKESLSAHTDPIKELDLFIHFYFVVRFREQIILLSLNDRFSPPYDITRYEVAALERVGGLKKRKYYDESDQHTRTLLTVFYELGYFKKCTDRDDNTYTWAGAEPKISTMYQLIYRFDRVTGYVTVGTAILDILTASAEANLTQHTEYLRGNASVLFSCLKRGCDQQLQRLQFQAMVYQSLGRKVNQVRIVDRIPVENRTAVTSYDIYAVMPENKVIGVIVARFASTVEEALKEAIEVKLPTSFDRSVENVKYVAMNADNVEQGQPERFDVLVHTQRLASR